MDEAFAVVVGASFGICATSLVLFWAIWLRKGHYEMPTILKELDKKGSAVRNSSSPPDKKKTKKIPEDPMERNLFRFCRKMGHYLYFADRDVIMKDIGFEQMLYIIFMRRMILFNLVIGLLIALFIFVWARLKTAYTIIILQRLLGSRDMTLTDFDVNTFMSCIYTLVFTLFIMQLRKYMASRLVDSVLESEEKKTDHRPDVWYQIRTVKFRGIADEDSQGVIFKQVVEGYMRANNIKGRLVRVISLPYLEDRIKLEKENEDILNG
jgi:hypothetical protein